MNERVAGKPVVFFFQRGVFSALDAGVISASEDVGTAAAFGRVVGGRTLDFELRDGRSSIARPDRPGTSPAGQ